MANALYNPFKQACLNGDIDLPVGDIRVILADTADYTFGAAHEFLTSVPGAARVAVSAAGLGSKTITNGVFDAANLTLTSVSGDQSEALILYIHTGVEATSRLICFIDTGANLPFTPNGGDINVEWNASGIFSL